MLHQSGCDLSTIRAISLFIDFYKSNKNEGKMRGKKDYRRKLKENLSWRFGMMYAKSSKLVRRK
jgi:hypothetical protein